MPRPICVHCGNPYGRRSTKFETVKWPEGEPMPAYRGNGIVVKERFHTIQHSRQELEAAVRSHRMWLDRHAKEELERIANTPERRMNVAHRDIWDGETWVGGYDPFCTLRCALDYARKAYARNKQTKLKAV